MRILVVDDDHLSSRMLEFLLCEQGYNVVLAEGAREALAAVEKELPQLVLLDVNLPQMNGFELFRRLRERGLDAPVIFVTAKGELDDRVHGLKMGGDDYITKPFQPAELVARIEAVLRRYQQAHEPARVIHAGVLAIDPVALEVTLARGQRVTLTPTEMRLLLDLARHLGQPVERDELLGAVWGEHYGGESNVVDVYIRRLRRKLEHDPDHPELIQAARGVGYLLADITPSEARHRS